jgi:hypothetical protein
MPGFSQTNALLNPKDRTVYAMKKRKEESGQRSDLEDAVVLAGESLDSLLLPVVEIFGCQSLRFESDQIEQTRGDGIRT